MKDEPSSLLPRIWYRCTDSFAPREQLVEGLTTHSLIGAAPKRPVLCIMLE